MYALANMGHPSDFLRLLLRRMLLRDSTCVLTHTLQAVDLAPLMELPLLSLQ